VVVEKLSQLRGLLSVDATRNALNRPASSGRHADLLGPEVAMSDLATNMNDRWGHSHRKLSLNYDTVFRFEAVGRDDYSPLLKY